MTTHIPLAKEMPKLAKTHRWEGLQHYTVKSGYREGWAIGADHSAYSISFAQSQ